MRIVHDRWEKESCPYYKDCSRTIADYKTCGFRKDYVCIKNLEKEIYMGDTLPDSD